MNFPTFNWRSLKTRVILSTLVIFVVGIWTLAFYASRMLREDMQHLLGEQQFSTASFIAAGINEQLDDRLRALEKIAGTISPTMLDNTAALQTALEQRPVFQSMFNGGTFATRLDGTAIASIPLSAERFGVNYKDRDFITAALNEGKATIGRPVMGKKLLAPVLVMAAPIRNAEGKVIGALMGVTNLNMPNFLDKFTTHSYGKTGTYLLAAPQHKLFVTSSDKSRIMRPLPALGVNPLHDKFAQGYEGYGILVNFRGDEELAAAKSIPVAGWFLGVALPTSEAFAPIRAMQQRMLWATILLTLLAGGLISWMLRRQLSPMLTAVETLATLSDTDQPLQPLPITRQDEIGQLIGGFNRLIETLKQRQEALQASEARFRCLTEMSSDFYWESDVEHRFTQRTERRSGAADSDLRIALFIGARRWEMPSLSPDEAGWQAHRALLDAQLPFREFEISRIGCSGAVRHVCVSGDPVFDAAGNFTGYRGTGSDITERKRAEDFLKAQQTQIKLAAQVFAQGREGILICDARGKIIMANKAFAAISGYSEAELLGKNTRILSSGRHGPDFYHAMWEAINTNSCWACEIWDRRKDGTDFPAWLTISAMHDEQGQVTHYLGSFSDLSDAMAAERRIQHLSYFDALTGLPNRALLQDRTAHTISMVQRSSEPMIMMLVAVDHFKRIIDSVGHNIGDELLAEVARRLSGSLRAQDTVARLSDKEFVLLLPGTPATEAAHGAHELLWKLAQPCQLGDQNLRVTVSIGIASYPENGSDFHTLLKAVDIAMRRAQVNGRNAFEFYTDEIYQQVWAREYMINALRNVLEVDQLHLVYQPLVDLQTGQISGMEALLRWQHPDLGAVSPAKFIPLAEEAGMIKRIGEWVLRRALRDIRGWLDKGVKVPHVAINVSPLQFHDNDLIAQVKGALEEWQVDPGLIYLEVTEGALMDDVPHSEAMLRKLKDLGVKLSLDDFGTGYSSLSYLKRFPFDKVKIDQSFVRDVTTSQSDAVLVKVIISMANGLGLKVVAEGVETEAQCEIMRTNGCDEIQGYFFSKPISAQAIEELFTEGRQLPPHLLRLRKPQHTLLLVDDEPNILASLK
ncbi:MAG: EAL domain-containing protein [Rhodoferax sp.]|uniref:bifunctional diguanylate cyclase/phosphodiesterase n=1 Tax=Rhodoferax sp. TaxID=50421 RepID=UPI00272F1150|nr:EAL domain-containing protein [Rhodoferax sp.]MDP1529690.1 EAL domain-containing protein [Rhodoferax sp.]MDP1945331.1 EAL domain-containing protein [Rhodoferax sp.]